MSDLARWLLEQIATDEAEAVSAHEAVCVTRRDHRDQRWHAEQYKVIADGTEEVATAIFAGAYDDSSDADNIGWQDEITLYLNRHDPAHVLAECDAKRRVVARLWVPDPHAVDEDCSDCDILRLLALPYADREGFREEWRS